MRDAMGDKSKAANILHKYYTEKYVRFSAFRREVKAIVLRSNLLRDTALSRNGKLETQ